jgi:membrane-bound ClpP family serine protease
MTPIQLFALLLASGLILIGIELFVPGAVLGVMGGLALIGAVITGFTAFPGFGGYIAFGILLLTVVVLGLWIRVFPRTRIGQKMTVSQDLSSSRAGEDGLTMLAGKTGRAVSDLRPAGFATIDGRRVDVVTEGGMIPHDAAVRVVKVDGNRVVVMRIES